MISMGYFVQAILAKTPFFWPKPPFWQQNTKKLNGTKVLDKTPQHLVPSTPI
jgi:hypothetical protein